MGPLVKSKLVRRRKCLLCRSVSESISHKDLKGRRSCAASICAIFGLSDTHPFRIIYENAQYCNECFKEIQEADVTLGKLEMAKQSLLRFQDNVYSKLGNNYFQITNRDDLRVSYKEIEEGGDAIRGRMFSYDEIVKIIYEKLDQECFKWERFSSEGRLDNDGTAGATKTVSNAQSTNNKLESSGSVSLPPDVSRGGQTFLDDNCISSWNRGDCENQDNSIEIPSGDPVLDTSTTLASTDDTSTTMSLRYQNPSYDIVAAVPELSFIKAPTNLDKKISCTYDPENCKKYFYDDYNLKVHIKSFHEGNPRPHECMTCGKGFSEEGRMKNHFLRVHAPGGSYMCEHCGKGFSWPTLLRDHLRKMHLKKSVETISCKFCGEPFTTQEAYDTHEEAHRSNKSPFDCIHCGEPQPNVRAAKDHYLFSHSESSHRCEFCSKVFATKNGLNAHIKMHSRAYKCNKCSYTGSSYSSLKSHALSHSNEKSHRCEICGAGYKYARNLVAHQRAHTGEKPYQCTVCDAVFREYSYLKRHEESHSSEKLYKCPHADCDKKFKVKEALRRHVRYTHLGIKGPSKPKVKSPAKKRMKKTPATTEAKLNVKTKKSPKKVKSTKEKLSLIPSDCKSNPKSKKKVLKTGKTSVKKAKKKIANTTTTEPMKIEMDVADHDIEIVVETHKVEEDNYIVPEQNLEITQEELNNAIATIDVQQTEEIATTPIYSNTIVYANHFEVVQPTTYEIIPISATPVTVVSTRGVNIVTPQSVGQTQTLPIQYRIEYKYD